MKRAEEAATKAYGGVPQLRQAFLHGYEQAEKDLALTWKDVKRIVEISDEIINRIDAENIEHYPILEQAYYEEVLRGFNNTRENHD